MSETTTKEINYQFKIIYALGIILVVANHCGNGGVSLFYEFFPAYAFHLGLFVFASGYFYKETSENSIKKYLFKKLRTLILPLYLWNFVYALFAQVMALKGFTMGIGVTFSQLFIEPITTGHQYIYNLASWFVVPLFMVEIFNVLFRKSLTLLKGNSKEYIYLLTSFILGMFGILLASKGLNTGYWLVLTRFLHFIPYYSMGYFYQKILQKHDTLSNTKYFLIVISLQLIVIIYKGAPPYYEQAWSKFSSFTPWPYIVGFLGIAFWLRITKILEPSLGKSKLINLIADNTFSIMVHQFLGFMFIKTLFAFCYKYSNSLCQNFEWNKYLTDIWYYYLPRGVEQTRILYVFAAIFIPILIQKIIDKINIHITQKAGIKVRQVKYVICICIFIITGTTAYLTSQFIANTKPLSSTNTYEKGYELFFDTQIANVSPYCVSGFSYSEGTYTWTNNSEAIMSFYISDISTDLHLTFTSGIYGQKQDVNIYVNENFIGSLTLTERGEYDFTISKDYLLNNELFVKFEFPDASSPLQNGEGSDTRLLALSFEKLIIQ